jgi:hypothetical protein
MENAMNNHCRISTNYFRPTRVKVFQLLIVLLFSCASSVTIDAQTFTNKTSLLSMTNIRSGCAIGVADMDGDNLDDIVRLDGASDLLIEYQRVPDGAFDNYDFGNLGSGNEWALCIADIDNNGFNDFIAGGAYNNIKVLTANATGTDYTLSLLTNSIFVQGTNFADINNDGWVDLFACHDDADSLSFRNLGNGTFTLDHGLINTAIPSGNDGNYGSVWIDYDNDGDIDLYISKCRGGVSNPNDPRRINRLLQNDGNNNYTDVGPAANLAIGAQSWATDFGDIDNDGDLDCFIINHDTTCQLMRNNGDGTFTDISSTSGMSSSDLNVSGIQCTFRDFDNDCFLDLLVSGSQHRYFRNNGNGTFTRVTGLFGSNEMESFAVGDLNNDGYLDIYAGYAHLYNSPSSIPDRLFMNDGGEFNYLRITLKGVDSNINGIGARLELYGQWGKQIREIRAGESYGIVNSLSQHFGIGEATEITRLVIRWPSGTVDVIDNPTINESICVVEGSTLPIQVFPESYSVQQGVTVSGGVEQLGASDNSYLVLTHINTRHSAMMVDYEMKSTSPVPSPTRLDLVLETSFAGRAPMAQRTYLYNYQSSEFELLDDRDLGLADTAINVQAAGDLSRFVDPDNGCVELRVELYPNKEIVFPGGPLNIKIDQVKWLIE